MTEVPEAKVAAFSLLLNLPWELGQMPFYRCAETLSKRDAVAFCVLASLGDAAIAAAAYRAVARASGSRDWVLDPSPRQVAGFVGAGLALTVVFEWVATEVIDQWQYAPAMPRLPLLGTGLAPLLQWTLLPPLVLALAGRRLRGARMAAAPLTTTQPAVPLAGCSSKEEPCNRNS